MIVSVIMIIYWVSNYSHLLHQSSSWSYSWWSTQTQTSETRTTITTFQSTLTLINIMKYLPTTMIKNLTMSNVNKCFILVISNKNNKSFSKIRIKNKDLDIITLLEQLELDIENYKSPLV